MFSIILNLVLFNSTVKCWNHFGFHYSSLWSSIQLHHTFWIRISDGNFFRKQKKCPKLSRKTLANSNKSLAKKVSFSKVKSKKKVLSSVKKSSGGEFLDFQEVGQTPSSSFQNVWAATFCSFSCCFNSFSFWLYQAKKIVQQTEFRVTTWSRNVCYYVLCIASWVFYCLKRMLRHYKSCGPMYLLPLSNDSFTHLLKKTFHGSMCRYHI